MSKERIAVDIDDVLAQTTEAVRLFVNERTGALLTREDYRVQTEEYSGYYERVWMSHGIDKKINYSELENEMEVDQSQVPILAGASFAIHELSKKFHIILMTARSEKWEKATRIWIKSHFGNDDIEIYFTNSHKDVKAKSKGQLCRELNISLLIDDNVGYCRSAIEEGADAILFGEYGWHMNIPDTMVRCSDWPAVMEYIQNVRQ